VFLLFLCMKIFYFILPVGCLGMCLLVVFVFCFLFLTATPPPPPHLFMFLSLTVSWQSGSSGEWYKITS
jgi:hypothetical protein